MRYLRNAVWFATVLSLGYGTIGLMGYSSWCAVGGESIQRIGF